MHYSSIGILAFILHFIINRDALKKSTERNEKDRSAMKVAVCYRSFLITAACYYFVDAVWGILYEYRHLKAFFPFIYSDTVFYFIFMFLATLTWVRYIVAYLNKKRYRSKILLYAVWIMFLLSLIYLMINRFHPFIFSFNENREYIAESGRYIAFGLQIALYMVTTSYMLIIAQKTYGQEKIRYIAVGLTSLAIELFQIFQILFPLFPFFAMGLLVGTCVIHSFVEEGERKEKVIYDNIATSLAEDYEAIYYIDIKSGQYHEFSTSKEYESMNVQVLGKDFFAETRDNAEKYAHPDDKEFAKSLYDKEVMLTNLEGRKSYSYKYRIMVGGTPRYFLFTVMKDEEERHFVLYVKDIDDEITAESMRRENQKKNITFSQIAESLASNYDVIYYVDSVKKDYISYETNNVHGQLQIRQSGADFYEESKQKIKKIVYQNDRDKVADFLDKDHMISVMKDKKSYSIDYRLIIDTKARYFRMTVRKSSDDIHFIIGVEDINTEIEKEKMVLKALNTEKELARRDELTGTKNKTAYKELEKSVQANIDNGLDYLPFALVICDANDLKKINDSRGHAEGDKYIQASARLLCDIFDHSLVFRIGGDEFVVFLRGNDYLARQELMEELRCRVKENIRLHSGPVLAAGMADYLPDTDQSVEEIFNRADQEMYEDKRKLKGERG